MYYVVRFLMRVALGFYFRRIESIFRVPIPARGPVLFVCNHPGSLTDSLVLASSLRRKIHFLATVQMFQFDPIKWFLLQCGVIPINRAGDNPRAMRSVTATFEVCHMVLEKGEAIGIFPEGITYDDSQLKEVKSGAARIALDLEHKHAGELGLLVVPVGLTYSKKERYRSEVACQFGMPLRAADFLGNYEAHRKESLRELTETIRENLEKLISDVRGIEEEGWVRAIKSLYHDRFGPGEAAASLGLVDTRAIIAELRRIQQSQPERAEEFFRNLERYQHFLERLNLADRSVASLMTHERASLLPWRAVVTLCFSPVAIYGWLHRAIPFAIVRWAKRRFVQPGKAKAQAAIVSLIAGTFAFVGFYCLCVWGFHRIFRWPASLYYALSLPPASLVAHNYGQKLLELLRTARSAWIFLRAPDVRSRVATMRQELLEEIKSVQRESLALRTSEKTPRVSLAVEQ